MLNLKFTRVMMDYINENGDFQILWFNGSEIVHIVELQKYQISDQILIGKPYCPACLHWRGRLVVMANRSVVNKPYCIECGGELYHLDAACSCGLVPHDEDCLMYSVGLSSN